MISRRTVSTLSRRRLSLVATTLAVAVPVGTNAQTPATAVPVGQVRFEVPPQALDTALTRVADQGGVRLFVTSADLAGVRSNGISGTMSVEEALSRVLTGTGFTWRFQADRTVAIERAPRAQGAVQVGPVRVEGSGTDGSTGPSAPPTSVSGTLPEPYQGGQVAKGARVGFLGNRDAADTPFAITSYTAELVRDQQARTLGEALANDPSVNAFDSRASYKDTISIRGFAAGTTLNGISGIGGTMRLGTVAAERIEVLKGPSALLNSIDSGIGGTINVVPARATDTPLTRLTASYESRANFGGEIEAGRRFGPDKAFGVRLDLLHRDGATATFNNQQQATSVILALDYRSADVRLTLDAGHQRQRTISPQYGPGLIDGLDIPKAPPNDRNTINDWGFLKVASDYVTSGAEYDFASKATAYATAGYSSGSDGSVLEFATIVDAAGNTSQFASIQAEKFNTLSGTAGVRGEFDTGPLHHRINVGGTYLRSEYGFTGSYDAPPVAGSNIYKPTYSPRPALGNPDLSATIGHSSYLAGGVFYDDPVLPGINTSIGFADALSTFDERLQLVVGLRRQRVKNGDYDSSAWTPGVGVVVKPVKGLSLYGNFIDALQAGFRVGPPALNAGTTFPPYKTRQYEAGAKVDLGKFGGTLSIYQIAQPNVVNLLNAVDPTLYTTTLNGEQRNRGVELTVFGEPIKGVRLLGGYSLIDAVLLKTDGGTFDGKQAVGRPKHKINLSGEWDTPFLAGFTLTGRIVRNSSQFNDQANLRRIPAWTRYDAGARYSTTVADTPVTFRLSVENLLDSDYWSGAGLKQGSPRTVLFSIAVEF